MVKNKWTFLNLLVYVGIFWYKNKKSSFSYIAATAFLALGKDAQPKRGKMFTENRQILIYKHIRGAKTSEK